jgi:tetratricopeptide (TPR) repeat protein
VLVVLLAAAYAATLRAGFVIWDDNDHVYENPYVTGAEGYAGAWRDWRDPSFYPLSFTTFYLEWRLTDGQPWLFHLDNVVLHAANAVMAGLLGVALGLGPGTAWAAAGLWGLHPMSVATVAWIAERKNVLSVFFYLAALLTYARSLDSPSRQWRRRLWISSIALALASLLSKATAVTLPVTVVLLHWARGHRLDGRAALRVLPYVALALLVGSLHIAREVVSPTSALGLGTRLLVAARALWFYVATFLWPSQLVAMYPRWSTERALWWGLPAAAGLVAVAALAIRQRRQLSRAAWFAAGFFLINIALVVGVLWFPYMRLSFVADHLAYTATLGLALLVAMAGAALLRRLAIPPPLSAGLVLGSWLVLAAASRDRTEVWRDTERLWNDTLAVNPTSTLAHNNLGVALAEAGRKEEARAHFEASLRLQPGDPTAELNLGVDAAGRGDWNEAIGRYKRALRQNGSPLAWSNLGAVAGSRGQDRRAEWLFRKALQLNPNDPSTHRNLGDILARTGRPGEAIAHFRVASRLAPRAPKTHVQLAELLAKQGQTDEAIAHYETAHRLDPESTAVLTALTDLLVEAGQLRKAADYLTAGVTRAPDVGWFHLQLALVLGDLHEYERALAHYEKAIAIAPTAEEKAELHTMAAGLLEEAGRRAEAIARYEVALATDPDELDAHYELARLLVAEGKLDAAAAHYREALRIDPDHAEAAAELANIRPSEGGATARANSPSRRSGAAGSRGPRRRP